MLINESSMLTIAGLIHLPELYSNFVEGDYKSIFAVALPYTNPFKWVPLIINSTNRDIAFWSTFKRSALLGYCRSLIGWNFITHAQHSFWEEPLGSSRQTWVSMCPPQSSFSKHDGPEHLHLPGLIPSHHSQPLPTRCFLVFDIAGISFSQSNIVLVFHSRLFQHFTDTVITQSPWRTTWSRCGSSNAVYHSDMDLYSSSVRYVVRFESLNHWMDGKQPPITWLIKRDVEMMTMMMDVPCIKFFWIFCFPETGH